MDWLILKFLRYQRLYHELLKLKLQARKTILMDSVSLLPDMIAEARLSL
ncbi:hypothetical protein H8B06_00840 [Sphingobacterium sp. DN00404]|uniref:Uncharacterized protein n=1 Tax=Sphingobacterium micropteri TaxID=2763501 RepID=A0ABR7YJ54_9SPHI|nr:hypothetical protein [Sphingobacterium micropteri]MBD1431357.1 hypothetical protein [Sphingobacterium micropteri]